MAVKFKIGDRVKLVDSPVRYQGRFGTIASTKKVGRGIQFGVEFPGRRATPLFTGRSNLVAA